MTAYCTNCGAPTTPASNFCARCGSPLTAPTGPHQPSGPTVTPGMPPLPPSYQQAPPPPPGYQPAPPPPPGYQPAPPPPPGYQPSGYPPPGHPPPGHPPSGPPEPVELVIPWRSGQTWQGAPLEVWGLVALIGVPVLVFAIAALNTLIDTVGTGLVTTVGGLTHALGFAVATLAAAGVAWLVRRGDPLGRVLAWGFAGALVFWTMYYSVRHGSGTGAGDALMVLAALVWSVGLGLLPAVTEWFADGGQGRAEHVTGDGPVDVRAAQAAAYLLGLLLGVTAIFQLAWTQYETSSVIFAVLSGTLAAVVLVAVQLVHPGGMSAAVTLSVVAGAAFVLVVVHRENVEGGLQLAAAVGVWVGLWARPEARDHLAGPGSGSAGGAAQHS